ncbi:MAG: bifunctional phosphopantothenoylcysteine decarboxylase/phosphopantothenate--cysteine ligase CoaBC [Candidatus Cloacimonadota bacterium]|nr:MAG: bifunctional phosphopantothenoylcysteine decarboxylase/phosphopantothenate--cysteine ligase CoaBC [Candidatus Cloacimonadota bacterium]PIE79207.1 MAG: bifunctional phosphopantothenoylcysteine decarboxylase/phosphopantothenate--cysteine ligase CoaBC [Candidatus Delongbacteria bacterium]
MKILQNLKNRKVLVGITGGIAAYKIPLFIRLLVKAGAEVKVIISENGLQFVTRVTLETVSKNSIYSDTFGEINDYSTEHIALTDWADIFVLAPATANIIGKFASGIGDDAISTALLAFDKKIIIAPAMNCKMYENFAVQRNMEYLKSNGIKFIDAVEGDLACGYSGKGRMAEPEDLLREVIYQLNYSEDSFFKGKKVLVSAGGTREPIDPVRYLANRSSGKTGFKIAEYFSSLGANVTLVSGINELATNQYIDLVRVESSKDMYREISSRIDKTDILIMSAAVADYTFEYSESKIKKSEDSFFNPTPSIDILKSLGKGKREGQIFVGFALETDNLLENGMRKLKSKNLDLIVLNTVSENFSPFGSDSNSISIMDRNGGVKQFENLDKNVIGSIIAEGIKNL